MRPFSEITDGELRAAEGIHTRDPADPNAAGHQLWGGNQSAASQPNSDAYVLEIALPSDDHQSLLALIARIEKVKGTLPPDVAVLRKNLSS
jgi:hypothetical protein